MNFITQKTGKKWVKNTKKWLKRVKKWEKSVKKHYFFDLFWDGFFNKKNLHIFCVYTQKKHKKIYFFCVCAQKIYLPKKPPKNQKKVSQKYQKKRIYHFMIQIIIINGLGGVGKSTFVSYCSEFCKINYPNYRVVELSTVDYVKNVASACGWNGSKTNKDRVFLSDLKKAFTKWNNSPITYVFNKIKIYKEEEQEKDFIFFVNSREPEDIDKICKTAVKKGYLILKLLVAKDNFESNEVEELIEGINFVKYDKTIYNNGDLLELQKTAQSFMKWAIKILQNCPKDTKTKKGG